MRLTLRTLLAHLDRTLDAEDDAAIAAKLRSSEFASQLVKRVKVCMASDELGAPPWEESGRLDDPNRIGEYLDSVLAPSQIAEVERICLESDAHLAEVAACHQILTIVLGQSAEVPATLRQRIHGLDPDRPFRDAVKDGIFGGGAVGGKVAKDGEQRSDAVAESGAVSPAIAPVGVDDSGVWDAATRLKRYVQTADGEAAEAGFATTRRASKVNLSDYVVRRSPISNWLIALGVLAAVGGAVVWVSGSLGRSTPDDRLAVAESASADLADGTASTRGAPGPDAADASGIDAGDRLDKQDTDPSGPVAVADASLAEVDADAGLGDSLEATSPGESDVPVVPGDSPAMVASEAGNAEPAPMPAATPLLPPAVAGTASDQRAEDASAPVEPLDPVLVTSDGSLLLIRDAGVEDWFLGRQGDVVDPNGELICPPLYRDRLSLHGRADLTMVGPARLELSALTGAVTDLRLKYGRFLIAGSEEPTQLTIHFGEMSSQLSLPSADSGVAIEVLALRPPGANPEDPAVTRSVVQVLAVGGEPRWRSGNRPEITLDVGQLLRLAEGYQVSLDEVGSIPVWLDEPRDAADSLPEFARRGLLDYVRGNESIELSLREAMDHRRAEVGALAARTMLLLGRHDVYFGAEGVFNQPRQRSAWPEHFDAMVKTINRGPETAAEVREAIRRMDGAQADLIYRMLWLYSDAQLAQGEDETLVRSLDDPNLTVRVLAAENLRRITGGLLNYRPEVDAAVRRATDIRRWEIRLRRGEIRWVAEPTQAATVADSGQSADRP